jgi:hypothetical protein
MKSCLLSLKFRGHALLWAGALTLLTGCGEVRRTLGLDAPPPDEFAVVEHAPLVVPRHFRLRPPQPGAPRPQEKTISQEAQEVIASTSSSPAAKEGSSALSKEGDASSLVTFEDSTVDHVDNRYTAIEDVSVAPVGSPENSLSENSSLDEAAFLSQIPAAEKEDSPLNSPAPSQEACQEEKPKNFIQNLLFWQKKSPTDVIDPEKEKKRLEYERHQAWREDMLKRRQEETVSVTPRETLREAPRETLREEEGTPSTLATGPISLQASPSLQEAPQLQAFAPPQAQGAVPHPTAPALPLNCAHLYGSQPVSQGPVASPVPFQISGGKEIAPSQKALPRYSSQVCRPLTHQTPPTSYALFPAEQEKAPKKKKRKARRKPSVKKAKEPEISLQEDFPSLPEEEASAPAPLSLEEEKEASLVPPPEKTENSSLPTLESKDLGGPTEGEPLPLPSEMTPSKSQEAPDPRLSSPQKEEALPVSPEDPKVTSPLPVALEATPGVSTSGTREAEPSVASHEAPRS